MLQPYEKETVITYDQESDRAIIYTHEHEIMSRLKKAGISPIQKGKFEGVTWATYEISKDWILIQPPQKIKSKRGVNVC